MTDGERECDVWVGHAVWVVILALKGNQVYMDLATFSLREELLHTNMQEKLHQLSSLHDRKYVGITTETGTFITRAGILFTKYLLLHLII